MDCQCSDIRIEECNLVAEGGIAADKNYGNREKPGRVGIDSKLRGLLPVYSYLKQGT